MFTSSLISVASPIIIVPGGFTALINLFNVKDFLQDGLYNTQKKPTGFKKENMITIERKRPNGTVQYQIVDNTAKFTPQDWYSLNVC